jgi:RHS repeat-associated protein
MVGHVSFMFVKGEDGAPAYRTHDRWMLAEIRDPLGNYVRFNHTLYREPLVSDCATTSYYSGSRRWYIRASELTEVVWSGNATQGLDAKLRMEFVYAGGRTDTNLQSDSNYCKQKKINSRRLSEVKVQARPTGGGDWETQRSYSLNHVYDLAPSDWLDRHEKGDTRRLKHLLLDTVVAKGKTGGVLHTYDFDYHNKLTGDDEITINNVRLVQAKTGYGAVIKYGYVEKDITVACAGCNTISRLDFVLTSLIVYDGVNQWVEKRYTYTNSIFDPDAYPTNIRDSFNNKAPAVAEWYGHNGVDERLYPARSSETVTLTDANVSRFQYYEFARHYNDSFGNAFADPRRGKLLLHQVWDKPASVSPRLLYAETKNNWEFLYKAGGNTGSFIPPAPGSNRWPLFHEPAWLRLESDQTWGGGAGQAKKYFYETDKQNGGQYGNVTKVEEYSHPEYTLSATTFNDHIDDGILQLQRTTVTEFFPNTAWPAVANGQYIVDRPARIMVQTPSGTCAAETRMIYADLASGTQNHSGAYNAPPKSNHVIKIERAAATCPLNATTSLWDASVLVQSFEYDAYGNQTKAIAHGNLPSGADDISVLTEYDTYYHLFPTLKRDGAMPSLRENALYFGINDANLPPAPDSAWGQPRELCKPNDICTQYGYDEFGRLIRRWDAVTKGASRPASATASVIWNYHIPGAHGAAHKTYIISEWRAPRCEGNLVRRHYNGLGQLVTEQSSFEDWKGNVDGCNPGTLGREIVTWSSYDALGKVARAGTPILYNRTSGGYLWYAPPAINWSTADQSQWLYDPLGRMTSQRAPSGQTTAQNYSGRASRLYQTGVYSSGRRTLFLTEADPLGRVSQVRHSQWNGSSWITSMEITRTYDLLDNLVSIKYPNNLGMSTFTYDRAGRLISQDDINLGASSYAYNGVSELIRQTDARGKHTCFYYDASGRLQGRDTGAGSVCPAILPNGAEFIYGYDAGHSSNNCSRGQLTSIQVISGTIQYQKVLTYEAKGRLDREQISYPATGRTFTTHFDYDAHARLHRIYYCNDAACTNEYTETSYNGMGLPAKLTVSVNGVVTSLMHEATYNEVGQLTRWRHGDSNPLWRFQLFYPWESGDANANGLLKEIRLGTSSDMGSAASHNLLWLQYGYDTYGYLTELKESYQGASPTSYPFTYDGLNRLSSGFSRNYLFYGSGRPDDFENLTYPAYDDASHPHAVKQAVLQSNSAKILNFVYDANGNMTQREYLNSSQAVVRQNLSWNDDNRLDKVTQGANTLAEYWYDDAGIRVRSKRGSSNDYYPNRYWEEKGGIVTKYYYLGSMPVAQRKNGESAYTYLIADHLGSIVMTAQPAATPTTTSRKYLAYGASRGVTGTPPTDFNYTGQRLDDTGLLYYNARYYDPLLGRFISPDTLIPDPTNVFDYDRYMYGRGNPLKYNDPTGHCATNENGTLDQNDGDCVGWVNTIYASWDDTSYWTDRWGSKDVFMEHIAPTESLDASFFQSAFLTYLDSPEYHIYAEAQQERWSRWSQQQKWSEPSPVDAVGVGLGYNADAPILGAFSGAGTTGVELVAHRNGDVGLFFYGGGGGGLGAGANAKVYVVRIRQLDSLEAYSGPSIATDVTVAPGSVVGSFGSPTSSTHGEYFGLAPGANISISATAVQYSQPFWLVKR